MFVHTLSCTLNMCTFFCMYIIPYLLKKNKENPKYQTKKTHLDFALPTKWKTLRYSDSLTYFIYYKFYENTLCA